MNRAYQEELARVRTAALLETLGNLCGLAIERGDSAARERIGALIDALQQYQDSEPKEPAIRASDENNRTGEC